jgi:hypothetical protein
VRTPAALLLALLLAGLVAPGAARAHPEGTVAVEIVPSRPGPGEVVGVIGEGFTPGGAVVLTLLTGAGPVEVGRPAADADGHFAFILDLADDLPARAYELQAADAEGVTDSGYLTIVDPAETPVPVEAPGQALPPLADLTPLLAGFAVTILLAGLLVRSGGRRR